MARARDMQGVPAQIVTPKNNDNNRRHPSHCIYHEGKGKNRICKCERCGYYLSACHSAAKCDYYEEEGQGK